MAGTALDQTAVRVGTASGPGLWLAPLGTTLPTDADSALDAAFYTPGYISDEGVTVASDVSTEDLFAWQAASPVRTLLNERTYTFEMTLIETEAEALAVYFDTTTTGDLATGLTVPIPDQPEANHYAAVIEGKDGLVTTRLVFGKCTLSDAGDIEMTRSGLQGYPVTLKVLADAGNAVYVKKAAA